MDVTTKKLGNSRVELSIYAGQDEVLQKYEEVYADITRQVRISGFRPGKAPRDIIEKRFHETAKSTVVQGLVDDLYKQTIEQENLFVLNHPQISEVNLKDGSFFFKAVVEVKPEVNLKRYKGIKINRETVEITDDKVQQALENIKKEKKAETLDDNFARSLGYPSLSNLEEVVRHQLFLALSENSRRKSEAQLTEFLINNSELDIPRSLIERELNERLNLEGYRLMQQGLNKQQTEDKKKELEGTLREVAIRDLKVYFILDKIASLENIEIDKKEGTGKVMEFLFKEAEWV